MPILPQAEDNAERADDEDPVSDSTAPSRTIIEHCPSGRANAVGNDLRLTRPEVPMFDARSDRDVRSSVLPCPLQRRRGRPILVLTGADFFDDGIWNQDCGSEALDQVESADAGEQNDW